MGGAAPGRAPLLAGLVALLALLQSAEVAGGFQLLGLPGVWALPPIAASALGALVGFAAARARAAEPWRAVLSDGARLVGPPYVLAVLLAAAVIGPAVASDGVGGYLADPGAYLYLLNLLGWPRFYLPGVFEFNDLPGVVNRNVWMVPAGLLILAAACWRSERRLLRAAPLALAGALALAGLAVEALDVPLGPAPNVAELALRGDAFSALLGGFLGAAIFRGRALVPSDGRVAAGAAAVLLLLAAGGDASWAASAWFRAVLAPLVAHLAVLLSLRAYAASGPARRVERHLAGFLFLSFPLQQLVAGLAAPPFLLNFAAAGLAAPALSAVFGRLVGRRLLGGRLRDRLEAADGYAMGPVRRPSLALDPRSALVHLAVGAVLIALCFGVMFMLYIAFSPDPGGI